MKQDRRNEYPTGHLSNISKLANGHSGEARTTPIVVHVSRPMEIENTRKDRSRYGFVINSNHG